MQDSFFDTRSRSDSGSDRPASAARGFGYAGASPRRLAAALTDAIGQSDWHHLLQVLQEGAPHPDILTPFVVRAAAGRDWVSVDLLIDYGAEMDARGVADSTALHFVATTGPIALFRRMVIAGADRFTPDANGMTPLHCAALSYPENPMMIQEFLGGSPEQLNHRDGDGRTALDSAVRGHRSNRMIDALRRLGVQHASALAVPALSTGIDPSARTAAAASAAGVQARALSHG